MPATSHVRCHTAIIPGFGRPRQEDSIKFKANMSYLRRFCIKKKKKSQPLTWILCMNISILLVSLDMSLCSSFTVEDSELLSSTLVSELGPQRS